MSLSSGWWETESTGEGIAEKMFVQSRLMKLTSLNPVYCFCVVVRAAATEAHSFWLNIQQSSQKSAACKRCKACRRPHVMYLSISRFNPTSMAAIHRALDEVKLQSPFSVMTTTLNVTAFLQCVFEGSNAGALSSQFMFQN